jgi:alpha-glucosidase
VPTSLSPTPGLDDPPDLLVRWYQLGVFLPVMRVHSYRYDKAHFPFDYRASAAVAMRNALNLRYALMPYFYSLAHRFAATGDLMMKPLTMVYPEDRNVDDTTTEWLVGDLLAVPVLDLANIRQVYLPAGVWYDFNTSTAHTGPARLDAIVPLESQLVFVRQGSIVTLAPPLQYSDQLPGGPLRVQIYPGADASLSLVEDDGETYAYQQGQLRTVTFTWTDATRTLSWSAPRGPIDAHGFTEIVAQAMFAPSPVTSSVHALTASGSIVFP